MLSSHQKIAEETLLKGVNGSMRTITICVGSAFCMDRCRGNIGAVIDDKDIFDLTRDNVDEIFDREILGAR